MCPNLFYFLFLMGPYLFSTCIYFREGDITQLRVDAIVHSTNETLSDRNPLSDRLFSKAGPGLRHEIQSEIKGNVIIKKYFCLNLILLLYWFGVLVSL